MKIVYHQDRLRTLRLVAASLNHLATEGAGKAGLVSAEKQGHYRWNHLDRDRLAELESQLISRVVAGIWFGQACHQPWRVLSLSLIDNAWLCLFDALTRGDRPMVGIARDLNGRPRCAWKRNWAEGSTSNLTHRAMVSFTAQLTNTNRMNSLAFMGTMGGDTVLSIVRLQLNGVADGQTVLSLVTALSEMVEQLSKHFSSLATRTRRTTSPVCWCNR